MRKKSKTLIDVYIWVLGNLKLAHPKGDIDDFHITFPCCFMSIILAFCNILMYLFSKTINLFINLPRIIEDITLYLIILSSIYLILTYLFYILLIHSLNKRNVLVIFRYLSFMEKKNLKFSKTKRIYYYLCCVIFYLVFVFISVFGFAFSVIFIL